jgi:hypothetical protein
LTAAPLQFFDERFSVFSPRPALVPHDRAFTVAVKDRRMAGPTTLTGVDP